MPPGALGAVTEHLERLLSVAERERLPFALVYLDLDDKDVNDRLGHVCGGSLGAACYPEHGHTTEALRLTVLSATPTARCTA